MAHIYHVGSCVCLALLPANPRRCWHPDENEGWISSEIVEKKVHGRQVKLVFLLDDKKVRLIPPQEMAC